MAGNEGMYRGEEIDGAPGAIHSGVPDDLRRGDDMRGG